MRARDMTIPPQLPPGILYPNWIRHRDLSRPPAAVALHRCPERQAVLEDLCPADVFFLQCTNLGSKKQ